MKMAPATNVTSTLPSAIAPGSLALALYVTVSIEVFETMNRTSPSTFETDPPGVEITVVALLGASDVAFPGTGLPYWSRSVTAVSDVEAPFAGTLLLPVRSTEDVPGFTTAGVAVAVKVTGSPMRPAVDAEMVFAPAVVPSVHDSSAAMPDAFVCRVE